MPRYGQLDLEHVVRPVLHLHLVRHCLHPAAAVDWVVDRRGTVRWYRYIDTVAVVIGNHEARVL